MSEYVVVVWGDSIAAVGDWPARAEAVHNVSLNTGRPVRVVNCGECGQPAARACGRYAEVVAPHQPQLVIIQFGFNDIRHDGSRGERPLSTPDEFGAHLRAMIRQCRDGGADVIVFGNHRARVHLTMPTGLTYDESRARYSAIAAATAAECGAAFHDVAAAVAAAGEDSREIVCEDGVHLAPFGVQFYGRFAAMLIMQAIRHHQPETP